MTVLSNHVNEPQRYVDVFIFLGILLVMIRGTVIMENFGNESTSKYLKRLNKISQPLLRFF